jgi:hypothetical protein
MRDFDTGATRDTDDGKFDFDGFNSVLVDHAYAAYMHKNRHTKDGDYRESDNWQRGIPFEVYLKSALRHMFEMRAVHHGYHLPTRDGEEAADYMPDILCAILFNVKGYLHEYLKLEHELTEKVLDKLTDDRDALDSIRIPRLDRDENEEYCSPGNCPDCDLGDARNGSIEIGGGEQLGLNEETDLEVARIDHISDLQGRLQRILDLVINVDCNVSALDRLELLYKIEDIANGNDILNDGRDDATT